MHRMQIRMLRRIQERTCAGFVVLAWRWRFSPGAQRRKGQGPGCSEPSAGMGPSVARLTDGREGFIITEVPTMDEAARRDFDRAVAMLKDQDYERAVDLLEKVIEQSPGVTAPYIDIAIAYQHIGKPERAEEHLRTALTLFPGTRWHVMNTVFCIARPDDLPRRGKFMRRRSRASRIIIRRTKISGFSATCI